MQSIPQELHNLLRETLIQCDEMADLNHLRALFVTPELRPFQAGLPIANNTKTQVNQLISYLLDCTRIDGESILVLFVQFLCNNYDPIDQRHSQLRDLVKQLKTVTESTGIAKQSAIEQTSTSKILHGFRKYTALTLPAKLPAIRTIKVPMPQLASIEALLQDAKPVLITGGAGVGKSGIAYDLAHPVLENKGVLLLDARRLSTVEHLQGLRNHLELDEAIVDAIGAVGHTAGCRLIIDQLDSVFEMPSATVLCDLARSCARLPGVEVVVIARNLDRHSDISNELIAYGFTPITIAPLDEATSYENLLKLDIAAPPPQLITLGTNLLNLDLISRIQQEQPTTNFAAIDDEVLLWQYYLETIHAQERVSGNPQRANQMIDEAIRLAWEGLNTPERTITLLRDRTPAQQRLIAWELIHCEHGLIYSFRHEKLHEFLAAKDAVERNLSPKALMATINPHRTSSVVAWMDKLYVHAELRYRKRFITDYLAGENGLPFYTKLALLDRYIRSDISQEDPEIVRQILPAVEDDQGLRRNFFQAVPHYTWAAALWDYGFFDSPPLSIADAEGRQLLTHWDVQHYLSVVASDAWAVVIRHVQSIEADGWYIRWAIEALCHVPPDRAIPLLPRILNWLEDPIIVRSIDYPVYELMLNFAKVKLEDPAFALFGAIIMPVMLPRSTKPGAWLLHTKVKPRLLDYHNLLNQELPLLRSINPVKLTEILEGRLRLISALLADSSGKTVYHARWRSAIEDTDQDQNHHFEDKLLIALRDSLEILVKHNSVKTEALIARYLIDEHIIFRRLGLYLLSQYPEMYPHLVATQLLNYEQLDDNDVHHELFLLLRNGFAVLQPSEQVQLVTLIQRGFPIEREQRYREWWRQNQITDVEQELAEVRKHWIRNRLWMIRTQLTGITAEYLHELVTELGKPERPEFLSWHSTWSRVQDVSPFTKGQIGAMTADELVLQLTMWSPSKQRDWLRRESYEGLAHAVAHTLIAEPVKYAAHIHKVILLHPIFARAILAHLSNRDLPMLPWELCIEISERLVNNFLSEGFAVQQDEPNWTNVRCEVCRLLERGLEAQNPLPRSLYPRVQSILYKLLDDCDPEPEHDNPLSEHSGHDDPLLTALNHVRPLALDLLIRYQVTNVHDQRNEVIPASNNSIPSARCLSPEVAIVLTTRLDPEVEPSQSIRAVFGRHLPLLYRLDTKWTVAHLDRILPEADDLQSIRFFIAAWDSYVVSNWYNSNPQFMNHLRPKYYLAIAYLARGHVTKSSEIREGLADHLVMDYLQGAYAIDEPISQQNLLRKFFAEAGAEASSRAAWAAWRFCADHPQLFWPRVKALWTWRLQEVAAANDLAPYQHEMGYFAQLPAVIYALESMASLRDLLTITLKCLSNSGPDYGAWEVFEEFLAHKVAEEPVAVIEFYQMMCDHQADPYRLRPNDTRRQILTVAAEQEVSRAAALAIIGSIAKLGEHGYKAIYDRFA